MAGLLFSVFVTILIAGWLWFFIVRPILEDYGIIRDGESVNDNAPAPPVVMSRSGDDDARLTPSVSQTDEAQTPDRPMIPKPTPDKMLDIFRVLRAAGVDRDELRGPWRAAGLPLDNNLWAKAKPAAPEDGDVLITPWAGRRTSKKFYPDEPELEYRPPR